MLSRHCMYKTYLITNLPIAAETVSDDYYKTSLLHSLFGLLIISNHPMVAGCFLAGLTFPSQHIITFYQPGKLIENQL